MEAVGWDLLVGRRHDWTGDRLYDRGSRLKYLLTEVGLGVWAITERQMLPWQKLLELLLKGR